MNEWIYTRTYIYIYIYIYIFTLYTLHVSRHCICFSWFPLSLSLAIALSLSLALFLCINVTCPAVSGNLICPKWLPLDGLQPDIVTVAIQVGVRPMADQNWLVTLGAVSFRCLHFYFTWQFRMMVLLAFIFRHNLGWWWWSWWSSQWRDSC